MPRKHEPRPERCVRCDRPVYPQTWRRIKPDAIPADGAVYGAHGLCAACYKRKSKAKRAASVRTVVARFDRARLPRLSPEERARAAVAHAVTAVGATLGTVTVQTDADSVLTFVIEASMPASVTETEFRAALVAGLAAYARPGDPDVEAA